MGRITEWDLRRGLRTEYYSGLRVHTHKNQKMIRCYDELCSRLKFRSNLEPDEADSAVLRSSILTLPLLGKGFPPARFSILDKTAGIAGNML